MEKIKQWFKNLIGDLLGETHCYYCNNTLWRTERGEDVHVVRKFGGFISGNISYDARTCKKCSPHPKEETKQIANPLTVAIG